MPAVTITPIEQAFEELALNEGVAGTLGRIFDTYDGGNDAVTEQVQLQLTHAVACTASEHKGNPIELLIVSALGIGFALGARAERVRFRRDGTPHPDEVAPGGAEL